MWPDSSAPHSSEGVVDGQSVKVHARGLSLNERILIALLGVAVVGVFGCWCWLLATHTWPTGDEPAKKTLDQPTPVMIVTVIETPTVAETPTGEPSPTFTVVVEVTPTPTIGSTVEETATSRPTVDPTELWLQHWDRPGSTLDPESWFRVVEMTWDAIESAVDSGDRQGACGYSVRFKIEEAENGLNEAPPPGQLVGAETLLRNCLLYWMDAADTLPYECHSSSRVPYIFRMNVAQGRDALEAARREIGAYRQGAGSLTH